MTETRVDRYRQLLAQLGEQPARALLDKLQVLALTQPDALRKFESLIARGFQAERFPVFPSAVVLFPKPDRRQNPDRRTTFVVPAYERRRVVRRLSDQSAIDSRE